MLTETLVLKTKDYLGVIMMDRSERLRLVIEELLKDIDMSGEEWNDYDKDGIPYWEKWHKND